MKCYDYDAVVSARIRGFIWAEDKEEARKLIKTNEANVDADSVKIHRIERLKLKEATDV